MKVGHIAVYTENMEASVRFYQLLGGREGMRSTLDLGGGKSKDLLHMVFDGETTVELVCPSDKGMLPRVTGTCEHFCFNVEDVDAAVRELRAAGVDSFLTEEPYSRDIFGGVRIVFLTGPSGELIELFQDHLSAPAQKRRPGGDPPGRLFHLDSWLRPRSPGRCG